ncbi:MAG: hypothetical protein FWD43_05685 [Coriobacteriia bacterium]|nr:hypothetical protein [Coriobacteriia bacterium]
MQYHLAFFIASCLIGLVSGLILRIKYKITWEVGRVVFLGLLFAPSILSIVQLLPFDKGFIIHGEQIVGSYTTDTIIQFLVFSVFNGMCIGWCLSMIDFKKFVDRIRKKKSNTDLSAIIEKSDENASTDDKLVSSESQSFKDNNQAL